VRLFFDDFRFMLFERGLIDQDVRLQLPQRRK
jgi:hypothetical protein